MPENLRTAQINRPAKKFCQSMNPAELFIIRKPETLPLILRHPGNNTPCFRTEY